MMNITDIIKIIKRVTNNEDHMQDCLEHILLKQDQINKIKRSEQPSYIYTIAQRKIYDLEEYSRKEVQIIHGYSPEFIEDADDDIMYMERLEEIKSRLTPEEDYVFEEYMIKGIPTKDLNISEATLYRRVKSIRNKTMKILKEDYDIRL